MKEEYGISIAEALDILDHTDRKSVNKISKSFMEFLKENSEDNYKVDIDYSKSLSEMNLSEKTLSIIALISYNYWCDEEEKLEMIDTLKQNDIKKEQEIREKYHTDNLFEKHEENVEENESTEALMVMGKENILTRIINKIKKIFKR